MEKRSSKRASVAFLCACVWAAIVLCLYLPVRPAQKAHAAVTPNDEITITATSINDVSGSGTDGPYTWGIFYRGMEIPTELKYRIVDDDGNVEEDGRGNPKEGTIIWDDAAFDENDLTYDLGELEYESVLDTGWANEEYTHDFIGNAGNKDWDSVDGSDETHWAECSDCGFQLEVGHRLGTDGECKDCGATLDGYVNEYSFTIPDTFPNDYYEWTTDENAVATIAIPFTAQIFAGFTLSLNLKCSGFMTNASGDKISYEVAASADYGAQDENFDMDGSNAYPIWSYTPEDEDIGDDNRTNITDSTIYITLTLLLDEGEALYPGEYSDTLTFSAELIDDSEGY